MSEDTMIIEILPDGAIKTTIEGHVSPANHASAEAFLREQARMAGGAVSSRRLNSKHTHRAKHEHHHKNE